MVTGLLLMKIRDQEIVGLSRLLTCKIPTVKMKYLLEITTQTAKETNDI